MKYQVVVEGRTFEIEIGPDGRVWVDRRPLEVDLEGIDGLPQYSLLVDHRSYEADVEEGEDGACRVMVAGRSYRTTVRPERLCKPADEQPRAISGPEGLTEVPAPLPGLLADVRVRVGQRVKRGAVVAILESMKMNLELCAPRAGIVESVGARAGARVDQGEVLVTINTGRQPSPSS